MRKQSFFCPPFTTAQGTGKGASPDAVRWVVCSGAEPTGDPMMLVGLSCHLLHPLLECDLPLPPKKNALSRVKDSHLYLRQTDKLTSISACEPPHSSPGTPPRCRGAEQCMVNTDLHFCLQRSATVRANQAHATTASDLLPGHSRGYVRDKI